MRMRAVTLWQPWASLVDAQAKRFETRSWDTEHRGWLAIHAAAGPPKWTAELARQGPFLATLCQAGVLNLPAGCVVCIAWLSTTMLMTPALIEAQTSMERAFGDWRPGRYAWQFTKTVRLEPTVPATGHQGLWYWDVPGWVSELLDETGKGEVHGKLPV